MSFDLIRFQKYFVVDKILFNIRERNIIFSHCFSFREIDIFDPVFM